MQRGCRSASEAINSSKNAIHPYFRGPIKEKPQKKVKNFKTNKFKLIQENIKFREDSAEEYTIYSSPRIYLTTTKFGLNLFRRYMAGKNYIELSKEIPISLLEKYTRDFINKGLLILENKDN